MLYRIDRRIYIVKNNLLLTILDEFFFYEEDNTKSKKLNIIDIGLILFVILMSAILLFQHFYWENYQTKISDNNITVSEYENDFTITDSDYQTL